MAECTSYTEPPGMDPVGEALSRVHSDVLADIEGSLTEAERRPTRDAIRRSLVLVEVLRSIETVRRTRDTEDVSNVLRRMFRHGALGRAHDAAADLLQLRLGGQ